MLLQVCTHTKPCCINSLFLLCSTRCCPYKKISCLLLTSFPVSSKQNQLKNRNMISSVHSAHALSFFFFQKNLQLPEKCFTQHWILHFHLPCISSWLNLYVSHPHFPFLDWREKKKCASFHEEILWLRDATFLSQRFQCNCNRNHLHKCNRTEHRSL